MLEPQSRKTFLHPEASPGRLGNSFYHSNPSNLQKKPPKTLTRSTTLFQTILEERRSRKSERGKVHKVKKSLKSGQDDEISKTPNHQGREGKGNIGQPATARLAKMSSDLFDL